MKHGLTRLKCIHNKRTLFHALDKVFRPLGNTDNPSRQEPASVKKLKKGDATWTTRKTMLGWLMDTLRGTVELPEHRKARLRDISDGIRPDQRCVPIQQWHKVLGELRSMAMAIPGARGLFSLLQEAFRHVDGKRSRLRLSKDTHTFLNDFRWMSDEIAARPTRIAETMPTQPTVIGACDAAGEGMGGVCFLPTADGVQPCLWRHPFPASVQSALVSSSNPRGSTNNSDLELCGNTAHHDAITSTADARELTVWTASDNTANVHWNLKGSTTTTGPPAFLLRVQAFHQRFHRYVPTHDCIPGPANTMADMCSPTALARMPTNTRAAFIADLSAVEEAILHGVSPETGHQKDEHWEMWTSHCLECGIDPFLREFQDPVPCISVFAHRYRTGAITPSKRAVRATTASAVLCSVGQAFLRVGTKDPRLASNGKQDFRLTRQISSCTKKDPPPARVRPMPATSVTFPLNMAHNSPAPQDEAECACADMVCTAFFFLLRPGEHTGTTNDDAAFRLEDIHLFLGSRKPDMASSPACELEAATSVSLCFTTQKNQRKGDATAHGRSGHPLCCPVRSVVRSLLRHRLWFAARRLPCDPAVKLATHCHRDKRCATRATDITQQLRFAADACFHATGLPASDISARSLRAGGAMALLCGDVDSDTQ